jgi:hypothetical protein
MKPYNKILCIFVMLIVTFNVSAHKITNNNTKGREYFSKRMYYKHPAGGISIFYDMKLIPLSQTKRTKNSSLKLFAKVSDSDFKELNKYKWQAFDNHGYGWYARTTNMHSDTPSMVFMHRFILGVYDPKKKVDHKDRDTLNNQRDNLRIATTSQNAANKKSCKNSTSKFLGVSKRTITEKRKEKIYTYFYWVSTIKVLNKNFFCGNFPYTPEGEIEAARAYDKKAKELQGEFANLNFKE